MDLNFSAVVEDHLRKYGWSPDRCVDADHWIEPLIDDGYLPSKVAEEALAAFGGLEFPAINVAGPYFANDEPLRLDPIDAGFGHRVLATQIEAAIGDSWFPFGEWISSISVFISPSGRMVANGMGRMWDMGNSLVDGIEFALLAHRPLRRLDLSDTGESLS